MSISIVLSAFAFTWVLTWMILALWGDIIAASWRYLGYVIRHKWYVYKECRHLGIGFWQSFKHDWTKLLPCEFIPYMIRFELKCNDAENRRAWDIAWLHHIHWNPHHWNHWVLNTDHEGVQCLRMPEKYVREMVADWRGVGVALGKGRENAVAWYLDNKDTLALHPQTRSRVETLLSVKIPDRYVQVVPFPLPREPGS